MQEKFYTVEDISKMLGMHPKTIQRYIREGKLRAAKVGKAWRISGQRPEPFHGECKPDAGAGGKPKDICNQRCRYRRAQRRRRYEYIEYADSFAEHKAGGAWQDFDEHAVFRPGQEAADNDFRLGGLHGDNDVAAGQLHKRLEERNMKQKPVFKTKEGRQKNNRQLQKNT